MLTIKNLAAIVDKKTVLSGVNLEVKRGEVCAIMGANGSGKTSLSQVLMGDPRLQVQDLSQVVFEGKDLLAMTSDERSRAGLFVAWQNPVTIPGLTVFNLCKTSYESVGNKIKKLTEFKQKLEVLAVRVGLTKEHVARNLNEGFSGGEKKRLELLQLLLLEPKLAILDEIDSGLDAHGRKIVAEIVNEMKAKGAAFILITHNKILLEDIAIDKVGEMKHGKISAGI